MDKYKVIDPKGITVDGKLIEEGGTVSIPKGASLNAFLHFKQVKAVKEKAEDPDAEAKKAEAEKAAAEQKAADEAKAKSDAEAKGGKK